MDLMKGGSMRINRFVCIALLPLPVVSGLVYAKATLDAERRQAMSYSISTLLTRNLHDVFAENDPKRRHAAIDEIFTEDCVFYEPGGGVYRGRDEIDRVAGAIRATHPDFRYQPLAAPEEVRSEEHTSELQSPYDLVCRLLLEKKKQNIRTMSRTA